MDGLSFGEQVKIDSQPEKYDDQRIGGIDRRKDGKSNVQTESDTAARTG